MCCLAMQLSLRPSDMTAPEASVFSADASIGLPVQGVEDEALQALMGQPMIFRGEV